MKQIITLRNAPNTLSEAQKFAINQQLAEIFESQKLYLQPRFSLRDLSRQTHLSTNLLSAFFNQVIGMHFSSYMNGLRIRYFKEAFCYDTALHFTLAALSNQCGFHNRNTFITAFKKVEGSTPSQYMRLNREGLQMKKAV